jgi:hypothetical protein
MPIVCITTWLGMLLVNRHAVEWHQLGETLSPGRTNEPPSLTFVTVRSGIHPSRKPAGFGDHRPRQPTPPFLETALMDLGVIVLRLAHVAAGLAWAGGAFAMILLINPTAKLRGRDGDGFMSTLLTKGKASRYFEIAAVTTVVAGGLLYWRASNGFQLGWITSPSGIGFTIGAVAAIIALVSGALLVGPNGKRAGAIEAEVAAAGGVASQAQLAELDGIRTKLGRFAMADLVLLGTAVVTMATARYW